MATNNSKSDFTNIYVIDLKKNVAHYKKLGYIESYSPLKKKGIINMKLSTENDFMIKLYKVDLKKNKGGVAIPKNENLNMPDDIAFPVFYFK